MVDKEGEDLVAEMAAKTALEEAGIKDVDPKCLKSAKDAIAPSVKEMMKQLEADIGSGKAPDLEDDTARNTGFKIAVDAYKDCKAGISGI